MQHVLISEGFEHGIEGFARVDDVGYIVVVEVDDFGAGYLATFDLSGIVGWVLEDQVAAWHLIDDVVPPEFLCPPAGAVVEALEYAGYVPLVVLPGQLQHNVGHYQVAFGVFGHHHRAGVVFEVFADLICGNHNTNFRGRGALGKDTKARLQMNEAGLRPKKMAMI